MTETPDNADQVEPLRDLLAARGVAGRDFAGRPSRWLRPNGGWCSASWNWTRPTGRSRWCSTVRSEVSIVVPVLDEAPGIAACLRRLRRDFPECDLVVVDGGSRDGTAELAAEHARVVPSAPGRGRQMNAGAAASHGEILWFVHADCTIPAAALPALLTAMADPNVVGGGLTLRFDQRSAGLRWLAVTSNARARRLGWVFGDQAMFVRRAAFGALGGFPEIPLMEDLELSRQLRLRGRLVVLPVPCTASARRLVQHGPWRMAVLMQVLKVQYLAGVDPERIRRRYDAGTRRGRRAAALAGSQPTGSRT